MSNVIFAPSNATYHTDTGTHTASAYSSGYSQNTVDKLSPFGYTGSAGSSGSSGVDLSTGSSIGNFLSDVVSRSGSSFADSIREAMQIANGNSALSQSYAREQMDFQRESDLYAMNWSAQEAAKTRDWQEQMSNTAHQREVDDLVKAGLNPVLSANAGASTPAGATGSGYSSNGAMGTVDTSVSSLFGNLINAATQLQMNERSLETQLAMNEANIAANERINKVNSDTSLAAHQISAGATLGAAYTAAEASRFSTQHNYDYNMFGYGVQKDIALGNNVTSMHNAGVSADATKRAAEINGTLGHGMFSDAYKTGSKLGTDLRSIYDFLTGVNPSSGSGRHIY